MAPTLKPVAQVVEIPVELILENPENPRGPVPPEEARTMADSLTEAGQKTEIRVRALTEAEMAHHPGYGWFLIGGHRRLAGAKLVGLPSLRAIVVEGVIPGQELLDALIDNRSEDMGWWKWDLAIEKLLKGDNAPSLRKLAAQLGWHHSKLVRAMKILEVLTPQARNLVERNLASQGVDRGESGAPRTTQKKVFLITESILLVLADLRDPQEVEKGLRRVLDDQMAESQVKAMVATLKPPAPAKPKTHLSHAPQGGGQDLVAPSQGADGNGGTTGGSVPAPSPHSQGATTTGQEWVEKLHWSVLLLFLPLVPIAYLLEVASRLFTRVGIKNEIANTICSLVVAVFVGSFLLAAARLIWDVGWNWLVHGNPYLPLQ